MGSLRVIAKQYTAAAYNEAMVTEHAGVFQHSGFTVTGKWKQAITRSGPPGAWPAGAPYIKAPSPPMSPPPSMGPMFSLMMEIFLSVMIGPALSGVTYTARYGCFEAAQHPEYVWYVLGAHTALGILALQLFTRTAGGFQEREE